MTDQSFLTDFQLIVVIANFGLGSKVLRISKEHGVHGGTIILGHGTHRQPILEFLELAETRKEIVLMIAPRKTVNPVLDTLNERMKLHKPNHGIAFVIPVSQFLGEGKYEYQSVQCEGGQNMTTYKAIFIIVDKGSGEAVVDVATDAGAKGATIINARGSGIHETSKLFSMDIEPEKEIVLILSKDEAVKPIVEQLCSSLHIDEPGNGIIFVQEVHQTYGIR
jgi:nitrogen regulatory protein PII